MWYSKRVVSILTIVGGILKRQRNYFCHISNRLRQMRRPTLNARTDIQSSVNTMNDIDDEKLIAYS